MEHESRILSRFTTNNTDLKATFHAQVAVGRSAKLYLIITKMIKDKVMNHFDVQFLIYGVYQSTGLYLKRRRMAIKAGAQMEDLMVYGTKK